VRPDPKEIGQQLHLYYPGYVASSRIVETDTRFRAATFLRLPRVRLAIVANCAAQGNMAIVMVLTSLVLSHHGHSLTSIALSHMFHSAGMFAFTIPLGRLADRFGRDKVMFPGIITALVGALLVALTGLWATVTLGTFLVGLGWAAANVAATSLIADHAGTGQRGRAIGVNETFAAAMSVSMALLTGPLVEWSGLPATGLVAAAIAVPPLALYAAMRLRGSSKRSAAVTAQSD